MNDTPERNYVEQFRADVFLGCAMIVWILSLYFLLMGMVYPMFVSILFVVFFVVLYMYHAPSHLLNTLSCADIFPRHRVVSEVQVTSSDLSA